MSDGAGPEQKPGPQWSFVQWHKAGFEKLVTILPVDAALHPRPGDKLKKGLGKAPGKLDAGAMIWRLFNEWPTAVHIREDYERWDSYVVPEHKAGIGLVLGREIAIDIDVLDKVMALELRELAEKHFGRGAWRIGNAPKAAMLLRLKEGSMPFRKRSMRLTPPGWKPSKDEEESPHAVEILAHGQQVVVDGIHATTRKPYMWLGGHPAASGRDSLQETDIAGADAFLREVAAHVQAKGWRVGDVAGDTGESGVDPKTPEQLRCPDRYWKLLLESVAKLPNTMRRDGWLRMCFSLRGAAGVDRQFEGFDAFYAWSKKWKGGENDDDYIETTWRSCKTTHLGWESLAKDLNGWGIPDVENARNTDAFDAAARTHGAGAEQEKAQAHAAESVKAVGIEPSPFWALWEKADGPFKGTRERIQKALDKAGDATPSDPDEAYLRVRLAMAWYGRIAWLGTVWVEYLTIRQGHGTEDTWPGIWSPVDEGQLELRVDGFIRLWLGRYASEKTIVAKMKSFLSKATLRCPRMRALMLLGPDAVLGETTDPTSLMEEESGKLIALPGGRCIEWGTGTERDIARKDCVLAALKVEPAPVMDWAQAPYLQQLLQGFLGEWDDPLMPMPVHWSWFQAWLGYCLAGCRPASSQQRALVLRGDGGEGKGTFFRLCREVLGAYAGEIGIEQLVRGKSPHANDEIAPMLRGKRFLFVAEASGEGMTWRDDLVKSLIANDEIRGRLLNNNGVRVLSRVVLMLAGNVMPKWQTHDHSVRRRFWIIRAPTRVVADPYFWAKVVEEKQMLLRFMLDGVKLWRDGVLDNPAYRDKFVFEDTDGSVGGSATEFYKGLTNKTAYGAVMVELTKPLGPGMRGAAELERDEGNIRWLECIPVTHLPWVTAAWTHMMRERGELTFPLMAWEREGTVAVAALRDFMNKPEGESYRLSKRFSRAQRRYLLATWRDNTKLAETVAPYLRYLLTRPPMEVRNIGKVPLGLPGLVPDLVRAFAVRGMLGDGTEPD
jgi:hypothetical protein